MAQDTAVGSSGSDNSINIGDGAILNVGNNLSVGSNTGSNNLVNVASGGSLFVNNTNNIDVTNSKSGNGISVDGNGTLQVGGDVDTGTLGGLGVDMSENANLEVGGTLTLNNNKINNSQNIILNNNLSTNTAEWTTSAITTIGSTTSGNSLTFTNGATGLAQNSVQLGGQTSSQGNALNVGGAGTLFTATTNVYIGANGGGNSLNIGDAAQMDIGGTLYLGSAASSTANAVNMSSNAALNVSGDVMVGNNSKHNKFTVESGMVDVGGNFIMGNTASSDGITYAYADTANRAVVGTNSTMGIHQDLIVGMGGNGNTFSIRDGGVVNLDGDAIIGQSSDDNYIFLMEEGTTNNLFNVAGDLIIGVNGGDNRFSIYGGTADIEGNLELGASTNAYDNPNYIHLATTNAVLNVANTVNIGASNSGNYVRVARGATINTKNLLVGTQNGVSNNTVTISGERYNANTGTWAGYVADSHVDVTNRLEIGNAKGIGNSVVVRNGGNLFVSAQTNIVISGTNNTLQIAGEDRRLGLCPRNRHRDQHPAGEWFDPAPAGHPVGHQRSFREQELRAGWNQCPVGYRNQQYVHRL